MWKSLKKIRDRQGYGKNLFRKILGWRIDILQKDEAAVVLLLWFRGRKKLRSTLQVSRDRRTKEVILGTEWDNEKEGDKDRQKGIKEEEVNNNREKENVCLLTYSSQDAWDPYFSL